MLLIDSINFGFRFFAKLFDYCAFYLLLGGIAISLPYFYIPSFYFLLALAIPLLWIPVEAFLLSRFKTTLGKYLFGISISSTEGVDTLSYKEGLAWSLCLPHKKGALHRRPLSLKKKVVGIVLTSLVALSALYGNMLALWSVGLDEREGVIGWVQYESEQAGFKISFPKDPEEVSQELVIPDGDVLPYEEVKTKAGSKVTYSVSYLDLPKKWRIASNTTLLKGVLDLIVKHSPDAILLEKEFGEHGRYRVLDYKMMEGGKETQGRLIITGSATLYRITVSYPADEGDYQKVFAFLNSFEVVS